MIQRQSLKVKLAFFATLLVIFVATSLSTYIRSGQKKAVVESQQTAREDSVRALRQVAREALLVDDDTNMVNYVNLLKKSPPVEYAMVLGDSGKVNVHTDALLIGKVLDDAATKAALASHERQTAFVQETRTAEGKNVLDISLPIIIGGNPGEFKGVARIGFDEEAIDKEISRALSSVDKRVRTAFLLALILGVVGALLLATFITRPLETLRQGAIKIGEGNLGYRINIKTGDELEVLAEEFNLMGHKLGELDEMKRDFVSNVTHELRSPLTSIRGYLELLQQDGESLSEIQKDYLSVVKNSSVRLSRFIDNLLDVAKIEANKIKLSPEALNVYELAHEMQALFKPQLDEKSLRLHNDVPKKGLIAYVDKDKLAEVFINLTSNAIKFTPENGQIRIAASEGPNYIELSVQDSGVGIPAEMIGKLFNKFEQVKSAPGLARQHKGTGLGLTIAKGIVEAHGGKIWIKSPGPDGVGTAFYFTVPKMTEELKRKIEGA